MKSKIHRKNSDDEKLIDIKINIVNDINIIKIIKIK